MALVRHELLLLPEPIADGIDLKLYGYEVQPIPAAQLLHLQLVR